MSLLDSGASEARRNRNYDSGMLARLCSDPLTAAAHVRTSTVAKLLLAEHVGRLLNEAKALGEH